MKVAVLFSGAKDSTFSAYSAMQRGLDVSHLISITPSEPGSRIFNHTNIHLTKLQAESMGIPITHVQSDNGEASQLENLKTLLGEMKDIEGVVFGTIDNNYERSRIDRILDQLDLKSIAPVWGVSPIQHWEQMLGSCFKIIMTRVNGEGLGREWLGRKMCMESVNELNDLNRKYEIHTAGENGEFETFVLDAPIFRKRLKIEKSREEWNGVSGELVIEKARLIDK